MCNDEDNQLEVPPSFVSLYVAPGGQRLLRPADVVRERYELCEDMAQMLTERAAAELFRADESEGQVLKQMSQALSAPDSSLSAAEAEWVVARLAELLSWKLP